MPCGGSWTAGTLAAASYTSSYSYDVLNRLTSGPLGSSTYGDAAHLDAVTAIGTSYTAAYDAAGNMTCGAPTSSATCAGTQTGAQLSYDNEGRLAGWQNAPGSTPTSTTSNLYDGEGNRVEQFSANGPTTTTVTYIANLEEVSTTAGVATTTTSYYSQGQRVAQAVNGVFSYLGSDGLASAEVALDASGTVQASVLYDPYGGVRYSDGTMPGSYAFTGQHADATTGLDYYQARYYDPVAGQFASADTEQDGLNRYAYVGGNPTTASDPSGHRRVYCDLGEDACGGGGGGRGGTGGGQPGSSGSGRCTSNCPDSKRPGKQPGDQETGKGGGCDDACQRANAISALTGYYEHERLANHVLSDIFLLIADAGPVIFEIIQAVVFDDPVELPGLIADVSNLVADIGEITLAIVRLVGKASDQMIYQLTTLVSFLHGLALVANAVAGGFALLNVFDGVLDFIKRGWKAVLKTVWQDALTVFLRSGAVGAHFQALTDEQIDLREAVLQQMSLPQLESQCQAARLTC